MHADHLRSYIERLHVHNEKLHLLACPMGECSCGSDRAIKAR